MANYTSLDQLELKNRRVLIRVDFNVPLKEEAGIIQVANASRIEGALPTIRYVRDQGGSCILASHLGRPKGKPNPAYSLEPVGKKLSELLGTDILLTEDCIGDGPKGLSHQLRPGDVLLLENLRFHPGEKSNDPDFVHRLAELCEVYVSDAFGTLHREHASTAGLPHSLKEKGIGRLVQKELDYLTPLREAPKRPFVLVMGGAKVSDKIGVLEQFLSKVDSVLIGGAMAYAFLRAKGHTVGKSLCEEKQVQLASKLLRSADARDVEMVLPVDHIVTSHFEQETGVYCDSPDIPEDKMGMDIGQKTIERFSERFERAETLFWNGPLGVFERNAFSTGTLEVAKKIVLSKAQKMAGGGDVASAIEKSGTKAQFDFISTGGGATLEFLEGKCLPGLKALELSTRGS